MEELFMKRRQFGLAILGGSLLGLSGLSEMLSANPVSVEASLFTHHHSAIALGKHYLTLYPEEANYEWLTTQTLHRLPANTEPHAIKKALKIQRQKDFYDGNTVMVEGWVLSRTEVRLCALLALA
jgi:hypothetical protein